MKKILLYQQAGCKNHGCEAIVKSIIDMLGVENYSYILASSNPNEDTYFLKDKYESVKVIQANKKILNSNVITKFYNGICGRLFGKIPFANFEFSNLIKEAKNADIAISIGGDIYSYGKSIVVTIIDKIVRKYCKKTILWGCSVNAEFLDEKLNKDKINNFRQFNEIFVRESLTYKNMLSIGVNNVHIIPDPAFSLSIGKCNIDEEKKYIGINVSNLIMSYGSKNNIAFSNMKKLIEYIIDNTDYNIALIPHVVWKGNNDVEAQNKLYNSIDNKYKEKITLYEEMNCKDLKFIISKCEFIIAGRTHASIAAYSTCVPTLVIGYSVKAKGIAKDLFGEYEDYVLPVQELKKDTDLTDKFIKLFSKKDEIKRKLSLEMGDYIKRCKEPVNIIKNIIGE